MDRTFTVAYTPQVARSATLHFWRRAGFLRKLIIFAVIAGGYAVYISATGERSVA